MESARKINKKSKCKIDKKINLTRGVIDKIGKKRNLYEKIYTNRKLIGLHSLSNDQQLRKFDINRKTKKNLCQRNSWKLIETFRKF